MQHLPSGLYPEMTVLCFFNIQCRVDKTFKKGSAATSVYFLPLPPLHLTFHMDTFVVTKSYVEIYYYYAQQFITICNFLILELLTTQHPLLLFL